MGTDGERGGGGRAVPRPLIAALGSIACLGAVAYAATPREGGAPERSPSRLPELPKPAIVEHPDRVATSTSARFSFLIRRRGVRFQCRLDRRDWRACRSPIAFTGLAAGRHRFSVRALDARGRRSAAARFRWRLLEPKDFSIAPQLAGLSRLYPGAPPVALPVLIANPNPVPIFVTGLRATATADALGCTSAENLLLTPSSISVAAPLRVPAGGSASLPAPGASAPAIQLRDLPINQDACQNAQFPLAFSGEARG
jgi:hypothetical protein